jgi:hypothetical protein
MKWSLGLIYISLFSYLGAVLMTVLGYPPISGVSEWLQVFYYFLGAFLCYLGIRFKKLGYVIGMMYGVFAMFSFSGVAVWLNYDGESSLGPYMALWDISIGVAMLNDLKLPALFQRT